MIRFFSRLSQGEGEDDHIINDDGTVNSLVLDLNMITVTRSLSYLMRDGNIERVNYKRDNVVFDIEKGFQERRLRLEIEGVDSISSRLDPDDSGYIQLTVKRKAETIGTVFESDLDEVQYQNIDGDTMYDYKAIHDQIYDYIKTEGLRLKLGYGPEHRLDQIPPVTRTESWQPTNMREAMDDYSGWIRKCIQLSNANAYEYGFAVDSSNNTLGVYEGTLTSCRFPGTKADSIKISFHTHPDADDNLGFSKKDVRFALQTHKAGGLMLLAVAANSAILRPAVEEAQSIRSTNLDVGTPFSKFPMIAGKVHSGKPALPLKQHYMELTEKVQTISMRGIEILREQVGEERGEIDDEMIEMMEFEFERAEDLAARYTERDEILTEYVEESKDTDKYLTVDSATFEL